MEIRERLIKVQERIAQAAERAGRDPGSVQLVAVSKTVPVDRIREAVEAGVTILGENRVQEAREKVPLLAGRASWHLVGHLQTNKAKLAVQLFDLIHSLDSLRLARELDKQGRAMGRPVAALLEVNLGGEESKSGTTEEEVLPLLAALGDLSHVQVLGLMTIPPLLAKPEDIRPYFRRLRALRDRVAAAGLGDVRMDHLSMGMSSDFEVAIEEGATLVRIGTAIFGPRPQG